MSLALALRSFYVGLLAAVAALATSALTQRCHHTCFMAYGLRCLVWWRLVFAAACCLLSAVCCLPFGVDDVFAAGTAHSCKRECQACERDFLLRLFVFAFGYLAKRRVLHLPFSYSVNC